MHQVLAQRFQLAHILQPPHHIDRVTVPQFMRAFPGQVFRAGRAKAASWGNRFNLLVDDLRLDDLVEGRRHRQKFILLTARRVYNRVMIELTVYIISSAGDQRQVSKAIG